MNKFILLIVSTIGFSCVSQKATAQWGLFSDLLSQLDSANYNQYFNDLGQLDTTWQVNQLDGNDVLGNLYDELNNPFPGGSLDSSYLDGLEGGLDLLAGGLPGLGLDSIDIDTILGEYGNIQDIFGTNFDSLGGLFGQYQDSLSFDSSNWAVTIIGFDDLTEINFNILQDTLGMLQDTTLPNGPGDFAGLIGNLFNSILFPDLELAFGTQTADLKYWGQTYSANSKVIRIGSVPRFNKSTKKGHLNIVRLPIEASWHIEASWNTGRSAAAIGDVIHNGDGPKSFNPLLLSGDFAIMAAPEIGHWGNTSFHIITSLGMEFGTYAPAHRDYNPPFTLYNQGFATGYGPQAGGGFSMTTGPLTIYSLATVAHGGVFNAVLPYRYNAMRFEAGMRFGNVINVRYSTGHVTWQNNDNRRANIKNQVTVGIILQELQH